MTRDWTKPIRQIVMGLLLIPTGSFAGEVEDAVARLERQVYLITNNIAPYTEREDLPRLSFLKTTAQRALSSIEENGLANTKTFLEFQKLIIDFEFSVTFFQQIATPRSRRSIKELQKISKTITEVHGFSQYRYTIITFSVYEQMNELFKQLKSLPIEEDLQIALADVIPVVGRALAISRDGDKPTVFPVAHEAYEAVESLYPLFDRVTSSDDIFNIVIEIQGLNEFYGSFAKFD